MKKALMIASVPSMIGQFNMNNIQLLQNLGYEVHIACNFYDTSVWTAARTKSFVIELREKSIFCHQIDFSRNPLHLKYIISSCQQLKRLVESESFNLIHCHTPVVGVLSRFVAHKHKIKIIYTAHGFHFYDGAPLKNWLFFYPVEWICSWWTDVLITINREDYTRAKKRLHAKNTTYVPGVGIDMAKFRSGTVDIDRKRAELGLQDKDIMLLSVGELSSRKNHETVIRALHEVKNSHARYFICGKGKLKAYLENLIRDLGMSNQIKLLGYRADISELCQAADLFILSSYQEGVSVALMEAIACRVPVICSKIRGNVDLVQDHLFDAGSVQDLTGILREIMDTREALHKVMERSVQKNYERIKDYELSNVSKKMLKLYE